MSAIQVYVLECDAPVCAMRYVSMTEIQSKRSVQADARTDGWRCTKLIDYCPDHKTLPVGAKRKRP